MAPSIPLQEARRVRGLSCCSAPGWAGFRGQPPSHAIVLCCSDVDTQSLIVLQHILIIINQTCKRCLTRPHLFTFAL